MRIVTAKISIVSSTFAVARNAEVKEELVQNSLVLVGYFLYTLHCCILRLHVSMDFGVIKRNKYYVYNCVSFYNLNFTVEKNKEYTSTVLESAFDWLIFKKMSNTEGKNDYIQNSITFPYNRHQNSSTSYHIVSTIVAILRSATTPPVYPASCLLHSRAPRWV